MKLPSLLLLLMGCNACSAAVPPPGRALCYANADQRAQSRVTSECKLGDARVAFAECPAKSSIMVQLQTEQEACK